VTICVRCLYDDTIPLITFDEQGVCSYCRLHEQLDAQHPTGKEGEGHLRKVAETISKEGRGKPFDCVVGVSGGCDSSYLLWLVKEKLGLRPLAVHFDNTWDSTIAVENIRRVLDRLGIELYTYVVDNEEYDDIYRSFLMAGVPDLEAPTDIGLATTLYKAAAVHGVKYIFEGHSFRTEGISPLGWLYMDARYIHSIHKAYGTVPMRTFPNLWLSSFLYWTGWRRIRKLRPLYYETYNKAHVKQFLASQFGWQWYGGHHLENRFTAFYHSYFLPRRFGIDTRLLGYCAQIRSGQMTREEGLTLLAAPHHLEPEIVELVKKRLRLSDARFEQLMSLPRRTYREFATYKQTFERLKWVFASMAAADLVPRSFYLKFTAPDPPVNRSVADVVAEERRAAS
jgi:N-acetyl sugar amidotransferase